MGRCDASHRPTSRAGRVPAMCGCVKERAMAYMVTGRYRVRPGNEGRFVAQMELLEDLLRREGRGLRYWALARSAGEPGVFASVAVWATPEDERRMLDHPMRQALLPNIT